MVLQRKSTPPGKTLGATTGWSLRAELARRGVKFIGGATYERIDDLGLHCTVEGRDTLFEVDSVVLCAGQEPERSLADELQAIGVEAVCIGGADYAAELDALRAIDQGIRVGLSL